MLNKVLCEKNGDLSYTTATVFASTHE